MNLVIQTLGTYILLGVTIENIVEGTFLVYLIVVNVLPVIRIMIITIVKCNIY